MEIDLDALKTMFDRAKVVVTNSDARSNATTGETEEHQAGSIYLSVDATGDWSVQVQVLK